MSTLHTMAIASLVAAAVCACQRRPASQSETRGPVVPAVTGTTPSLESPDVEPSGPGSSPTAKSVEVDGADGSTSSEGRSPEVKTPPVAAPDAVASSAEEAPTPELLAQAYRLIHCAQKRGEAHKLQGLYERFGFEGPADWTQAFKQAARDTAWLGAVTRNARQSCP